MKIFALTTLLLFGMVCDADAACRGRRCRRCCAPAANCCKSDSCNAPSVTRPSGPSTPLTLSGPEKSQAEGKLRDAVQDAVRDLGKGRSQDIIGAELNDNNINNRNNRR